MKRFYFLVMTPAINVEKHYDAPTFENAVEQLEKENGKGVEWYHELTEPTPA